MRLWVLEQGPDWNVNHLVLGVLPVAVSGTAIDAILCLDYVRSYVSQVLDIRSSLENHMATMSAVSSVRTGILVAPQPQEGDTAITSLSAYRSDSPLVHKVSDLEVGLLLDYPDPDDLLLYMDLVIVIPLV